MLPSVPLRRGGAFADVGTWGAEGVIGKRIGIAFWGATGNAAGGFERHRAEQEGR